MTTKIDIISGFLGAGKTTLIQKLLKEQLSGEKIVLIENEFGEIGIDGNMFKNAGIEIKEMNAGCICCTLVGDFTTALKEVLHRFSPDRILIEPSGVGKLSDVLQSCKKLSSSLPIRVNACITVADSVKYPMYIRNFAEFFQNQIVYSKTIILSRTQKLSREKLEVVAEDIRRRNPKAPVITTPWDQLSSEVILHVAEESAPSIEEMEEQLTLLSREDQHSCNCGEHHEHHHCHHDADEVFGTWGRETPHIFSEDGVREALNRLDSSPSYGTILRAKGIVQVSERKWIQFQYVPGESNIQEAEPDYTGRLCVIGTNLDKKALEDLFVSEMR